MQIKMLIYCNMPAIIVVIGAIFVDIEGDTATDRTRRFVELALELEVGITYLRDGHVQLLRSIYG